MLRFVAKTVVPGNGRADATFIAPMPTVPRTSAADELRRASHYRLLARDCAYPEGIDLLLLMAEVHEDEALAAESEQIAAAPIATC